MFAQVCLRDTQGKWTLSFPIKQQVRSRHRSCRGEDSSTRPFTSESWKAATARLSPLSVALRTHVSFSSPPDSLSVQFMCPLSIVSLGISSLSKHWPGNPSGLRCFILQPTICLDLAPSEESGSFHCAWLCVSFHQLPSTFLHPSSSSLSTPPLAPSLFDGSGFPRPHTRFPQSSWKPEAGERMAVQCPLLTVRPLGLTTTGNPLR